ncbi:hypothetical protein EJ06DRAFT_195378 [Trichodelitschia bisporula]|uniref:GYF domain-containing protein n=1 Tax=Trichodelitschia bisporula TaxID=703511 RepID=A0A6G1I7Y7_9PEZI|nr:hypothetical protein EJ06DRAFT_195378 [Trichodelitschia bisporula]
MSGRPSKSAPHPKRAGDVFARTHLQGTDEPSAKKTRFDYRNPSTLAPDAPEEDEILELDEIGKGAQQTKRNAVNLDGYDSDSDNDNFNARAEARSKAQSGQTKSQDENDMFADSDEGAGEDGDGEQDSTNKKKRAVRFLDVEQIEGQVADSKAGGHVSADFNVESKRNVLDSDSESSESGGDEERDRTEDDPDARELGAGAKRKHAPKLDAFNMRAEDEQGKFDESGNFVRKAVDPDSIHDSWLEGVSKKDIKRAREAQRQRDEERRKRDVANDAILTSELLADLINRLQKGEAVLEALQRLAKAKQRPKNKRQKNRRQNSNTMEIDSSGAPDDTTETRRRETVEAITAAADLLLTRGQTDIYDAEREVLVRQYKRETGDDWIDKPTIVGDDPSTRQWEYRWADARDGGERHGPYDAQTMTAWADAGYFGEGVEFRSVGGDEWTRTADFL